MPRLWAECQIDSPNLSLTIVAPKNKTVKSRQFKMVLKKESKWGYTRA